MPILPGRPLGREDRIGLVHPGVDVHTLGPSTFAGLLRACGLQVQEADPTICRAVEALDASSQVLAFLGWVRESRLTALGFSYRLDPETGAHQFRRMVDVLRRAGLLAPAGPLRHLYFAGLPEACRRVREEHPWLSGFFQGDETPQESLRILGVPASAIPDHLQEGSPYDRERMAFGENLVRRDEHRGLAPVARDHPGYGTRRDHLLARVAHGRSHGLPPLLRAHVGPYHPDRRLAVAQFQDWVRRLAASGHLDVLSIGTSQLSQEAFGEDWGDRPDGGGVPLNSEAELAAVYEAARPMLVRTYAGTRNLVAAAERHERTLNIAWHALSFWWFCQADGRGPATVRDNLTEHLQTLRAIATTGKPFEPNVPHHFAFRGADDLSYVLSGFLAAQAAKAAGIRTLVLQVMLNTPKHTWGVQDLAKARALLTLVRGLEDGQFQVLLQPRGGLDYFSPDEAKAKAQLAAVTALMDDIEPRAAHSPDLIHVVSYSEASRLADPDVVIESCQLTQHALATYRRWKAQGLCLDRIRDEDIEDRTRQLLADVQCFLADLRSHIPDLTSAEGLYQVMAQGYFPLPHLWACRDEFALATAWQTGPWNGGVQVLGPQGKPLTAQERLALIHPRRSRAPRP